MQHELSNINHFKRTYITFKGRIINIKGAVKCHIITVVRQSYSSCYLECRITECKTF